eukprot:2003887-Amphidinium_carterae.1
MVLTTALQFLFNLRNEAAVASQNQKQHAAAELAEADLWGLALPKPQEPCPCSESAAQREHTAWESAQGRHTLMCLASLLIPRVPHEFVRGLLWRLPGPPCRLYEPAVCTKNN